MCPSPSSLERSISKRVLCETRSSGVGLAVAVAAVEKRAIAPPAIGRNDLDNYATQQARLASRTVLRVAIAALLLGVIALSHFGLAPASW